MKRRKRPPSDPAAQLRQHNFFLFERILKAARFGDLDKMIETAKFGVWINRDRRKETAAALSRKRQLEHITPLLLLLQEIAPGGESLTSREVQDACTAHKLDQFSETTIRDLLDLHGRLEPDKRGPKRAR